MFSGNVFCLLQKAQGIKFADRNNSASVKLLFKLCKDALDSDDKKCVKMSIYLLNLFLYVNIMDYIPHGTQSLFD